VPLLVARLAKPHDLKRFVVILVMRDGLFFSTSATGNPNKGTIT
jgi:hypothetical protein